MLRLYLKGFEMKKIFVLILSFMIFTNVILASNYTSLYYDLKDDYPEIINKLYKGGATDADMERFLSGFETYIRNKNVEITEGNIDGIVTEAFSKVVLYTENLPVYNALTREFTDEAIYFVMNKVIPQSLLPLFEIVKKEMLANPSYTSRFSDINDFIWAEEAISALTSSGVITGYPDGTFRGNINITRAEFTKIIVLSFCSYDEGLLCDFVDVDPLAWYAPYIAYAKNEGIINGYSDNTFHPDEYITRQDISVIVYNAKFLGTDYFEPTFSDSVSISDYANTAVGTMQHLSIIKGMGYNLFYPRQLATRAQAVQIIYNAM